MSTVADPSPDIEISDGPPETVTCVTCGGEARIATWGRTDYPCYRCTECHAGGHLVIEDDEVVRRDGGVFRILPNLATREVRR